MPDGTRTPLLSKRLYELDAAAPGAKERAPLMRSLLRQIDYEQLADYDLALKLLREQVALGVDEQALRREEIAAERRRIAEEVPPPGTVPFLPTAAKIGTVPCSPTQSNNGTVPQPQEEPKPRPPRVRSYAARPATRVVNMLALSLQAAKLLVAVSAARAEFVRGLLERASARDKREEFMEDRAVAVVKETLLALDEQFEDVGFGSWMPFRYPDQWLMFCGVMLRVLAANNLIHAKDPDVYRRLLQETPSVIQDWRIAGFKTGRQADVAGFKPRWHDVNEKITPKSWGLAGSTRETESLARLFEKFEKAEAERTWWWSDQKPP